MSLVSELKRRNVFRVAAAYLVFGWLLTEVLTTILPTLGAPAWAASAVIRVFVFGFIPVVVLSWIYQLTPDGIKRDSDLDQDDTAGYGSIRKLDYFTIAALTLGVVFIALFGARETAETTMAGEALVSSKSIAVLPFVNMSKDKDNDYFSDGLTETLLHMLAQIPDLKVAARTSSFAFKDKSMQITEIAEALHVAHILEGSVQQAGNQVRITAQLIRAADGFHVWSQNYDRTLDDIFLIQDEIAMEVGGALSVSILGDEGETKVAGVNTESQDAYDLYLQALNERATFSYSGLQAAEKLLKGALTIDPDFLDAKTELASNYLRQNETGLMDQQDAFAAVVAMTDQVLAVRPDDIGAKAIRLYADAASGSRDGSPELILEAIRQLDEIVANHSGEYDARVLLTRLLQHSNQSEKALELQLDALQQDPYNALIHYEVGSLYRELGQLDEARAALQKSLDIEPRQPNAYLRLAFTAKQNGDGIEYLRHLLNAMDVDPQDHEIPGFIAGFLYVLGLTAEGDDFRNRVIAIAPTSESAYRIELLRAINLGEEQAGLAAARRAIEDDIDDRHFAYGGAVQYLMRIAVKRKTVEEESAYLETYAPGIFDIDAAASPAKYRRAQQAAVEAWFTSLPRDEFLRRLEKVRANAIAFGRDPLDDPRTRVVVAAMRGQLEQAIQIALSEVFTQPVSMHPGWRNDFAQAALAEFIEDSRIQEAMQNWENEERELRTSVYSFLEDLGSNSSN